MPLRAARVGRVGVIGHPVAKTAVVAKAVTPGRAPVARTAVVFGTSGTDASSDAPSDLYRIAIDGGPRVRVTRDRKSLNPLWGAGGIIHDRQLRRTANAPSYNLFEIQPDGGSLRRFR